MAALTHAELATQLVAEGAIAIAQGKLPSKMPVEAVVLTEKERARIAANPGEFVVFYPVGETGVFLEMGGPLARVWYEGVECTGAIDTLDRALKKTKASKTSEGPHPELKGMKVRQYRVALDDKRFVDVKATYPANKTVKQAFIVQLFAQERR